MCKTISEPHHVAQVFMLVHYCFSCANVRQLCHPIKSLKSFQSLKFWFLKLSGEITRQNKAWYLLNIYIYMHIHTYMYIYVHIYIKDYFLNVTNIKSSWCLQIVKNVQSTKGYSTSVIWKWLYSWHWKHHNTVSMHNIHQKNSCINQNK